MSTVPQTREALSVRDRLLNAAEAVVARDGVSNLTLDAVAREAGVSKGGLLYHFPSKSALVIAIVEGLAVHCDSKHAAALDQEPPAPGAFTRAYLTARTQPREQKRAAINTALLAAAGTNPQYLDPFRKRLVEWQSRLESDGIDPATASIVRLAIDGLCLGEVLGMPVPTGELRQRVLDRLIEMTRGEEG
ncbi:MAG TPA: TetR/AcrR family transcriptional regulator [Tepidisphaeraceae bacterium]|jgi:AcrR family transcriptional regulator